MLTAVAGRILLDSLLCCATSLILVFSSVWIWLAVCLCAIVAGCIVVFAFGA